VIQVSRRERFAIGAGVLALVCLAFLQWVVKPIYARQSSLEDVLRRQTATLQEVTALSREIEEIRATMAASHQKMADRKKDFNLFSFLDGLAARSGLKDRIVYMKPSTAKIKNTEMTLSIVEMKLDAIQVSQLVQFLHMIETSSEDVTIRRMSLLTAGKDNTSLNAILEMATIKL